MPVTKVKGLPSKPSGPSFPSKKTVKDVPVPAQKSPQK